MRYEALWDRTSDETRADLERARALGQRMVSLCSYGGAEVRHATVWAGEEGPEQRFEAEVAADRVTAVLARHAREGFFPALVGMTGSPERPVMALVLERGETGARAARLVTPRPFREPSGELFVARAAGEGAAGGFLRSVAAVGTSWDARGNGLVVAAVWAPDPPVKIAWAIHLDPVDAAGPAWRDRWETRTLETVARPVQAIPLATREGARWVVSLWHDSFLEPWPEPDPFAHARRFTTDEVVGAEDLAEAVARRRAREDRRVISLSAGEGPEGRRFLALYGSAGTEEALPRRFEPPSDHPIDRWALQHMRETGARHGQIVVVRRRRLAFARAYTFAEEGYPVARLDDAMRLGSVSKVLTAVALLEALDRLAVPGGLDAKVVDLLGFAPGEGPPLLGAVTLRHLLAHDAGLRTVAGVRPDDPDHPLSEARLGALLGEGSAPAGPGWICRALRAMRDDAAFARAPGGGQAARLDYSNEGFVLLAEILGHLEGGSAGAYEEVVARTILRAVGVDPGERGCLLGAGRRAARARGESPAHPASPTWARKRFAGDDLDDGPLVPAPYADNGPFLGGAAGWCVPLVWIARVLAALGPGEGSSHWQRRHAELAAAPAAPGSRTGHGVHLGEPGWWTFRPSQGGAPLTVRVMRVHHNGRLDGGSALFLHQFPVDARDDALDATLGVVAAFNALGPLYENPHGRQLLALLQKLEGSPGWDAANPF